MAQLLIAEGVVPGTPPAGYSTVYIKSDGLPYVKDDAGVETSFIGAIGPAGPTGPTGPTGLPGAPGSVWRNGPGVPSNTLGIDGDYYLNQTNGDYYLKVAGAYSLEGNLTGPQGIPGPGGTVTHTAGALTADTMLVGNGGADAKAGTAALLGAAANFTDFPLAKLVVSEGDTGHTHANAIAIVGEATSDGVDIATGVGGVASTKTAQNGRGVVGVGKVTATGDTGKAIGVMGRAIDTHAGDSNIGLYGYAANGATNYSFYGQAGIAWNLENFTSGSAGGVTGSYTLNGSTSGTAVFGTDATASKITVSKPISVTGDVTISDNNLAIGAMFNDEQINGIPTSELSKFTLSYAAGVVTLTKIADWYYYVNGKRFDVTATVNFPAHGAASGVYYFSFSSTGVATTSPAGAPFDITGTAQVAVVTYNSANDGGAAFGLLQYELHGVNMTSATHKYLHMTQGTKASSDIVLSGWTVDTDTTAGVSYAIAGGTLRDEDITLSVPGVSDGGPYIMGYFDAGGILNTRSVSTMPLFINAGNVQINPVGSGLTDVTTNNRYFNYYVVILNANTAAYRQIVIPGNALYTTQALAEAAVPNLQQLSDQESVVAWRVTSQYGNAGGTNYSATTGHTRIKSVTAVGQSAVSLTGVLTNHGSLTGRSSANQHPATAIEFTPAGNIAAVEVQAAIQELDTEKAALAGADFTGSVTTTAFLGMKGSSSGTITWTADATAAIAKLSGSMQIKGTSTTTNAELYITTDETTMSIYPSSSSGIAKTTYIYGSGGGSPVLGVSSAGMTCSGSVETSTYFNSTTTSGSFFRALSGTTGPLYAKIENTGGSLYIGKEGSTAGGFFTASTAYANVFYETSNLPFEFSISGARAATISSTGLAVVGLLDLSSASSGQIKFPATQNASSDANTLDDYEEGTWTPGQGAGLTVVGAFSSSGSYVKIGRQVTVIANLIGATSIAVSGLGELCSGLPFTVANAGIGSISGYPSSVTSCCFVSSFSVYSYGAISATSSIALTVTYFV